MREGDDWVLNGEKWFVTSEGEPGVYIVAAVHEGEQLLFLVDPGAPGLEIMRTPSFLHAPTSTTIRRSSSATVVCPSETASPRAATRAPRSGSSSSGCSSPHAVAALQLYASEMAGRVADRAVQILGGRGYMVENPAARFYRELRVDRIWEGTSEIQRLVIACGLFKRGAAPYLSWE